MEEEYIKYECNKCGCKFSIEEQYIDIANKIDRFLSCPLGHRDIEREPDYKRLMEQKSGVHL